MLSKKVTRLLLERGRVSARQLDEAARTQSFFGGQTESYLLKLGYIDEATLADMLTEVSGVPYASAERLRRIPPDVVSAIPAEIARRLAVVPFRLEDQMLRVAMLNPRDQRAIAEIQTVSGRQVEPWVTSEHRLDQALERHYHVQRDGLPRISLAVPDEAGRADPRESESAHTASDPTPALGLDGRPLNADLDLEDHLYFAGRRDDDTVRTEATPLRTAPSSLPEVAHEAAAADALATLEHALVGAADREAAAGALLDFCATRASRGAIFALSREGIRGLTGRGPGFDRERIRKVLLPPGGSTVLDAALRSRDFYFGVVPALPPNRDLYTVLGGRLPAMALVLPILVKDRLAALLYLDDEDRPITRPDIPLMRHVAVKAGLAFEILLLRSKLRGI